MPCHAHSRAHTCYTHPTDLPVLPTRAQAGANDAASMDADEPPAPVKAPPPPSQLPEVELFGFLLVLMLLSDKQQWPQVRGDMCVCVCVL